MKNIGALGEELVGRWLELHNHDLLQQNWRCRWGEIDLIARDRVDKAVIFVEVKTRSQNNWDEGGLLAVDASKQEKIVKTASLFLAKHPQLAESPCRFGVALVSYRKCLSQSGQTPRRPKAQGNADQDRRRGAKQNCQDVVVLEIGQAVDISQYQLTVKNYLQSAFELS